MRRHPTAVGAARVRAGLLVLLAAGCHRPPPPPVTSAVSFVVHDVARGRDVPVYAVVPTVPGPWPVILVSHGNQADGPGMAGLMVPWAAHGYLCLAPTHDDSVSLRSAAEAAGATDLPAVGMVQPYGAGTASVLGRCRDLSLLIDSAATVDAAVGGHGDWSRVGVAGHSSGAYTAALVAGATPDMDGRPNAAGTDRRPMAFVLLGPVAGRQGGLTPRSWQPVVRPLMNVTGSLDLVPRGMTAQQKREAFDLAPPGDKFDLFLTGANHGTFRCDPADTFYLKQLGGTPAEQAVLFDDLRRVTLAFWDAYLNRSPTAAVQLRSGEEARATAGRATVEWR